MPEVQPILTSLRKKHLKPREGDPALVLDVKSTVMSSIERHFSNDAQQQLMRLASALDPRHNALKFLSSADRQLVHSQLTEKCNELSDCSEMPKTPCPPSKRQKIDLLSYEESSDSNGCSPDRGSVVEKEVIKFCADDSIANNDDPLMWWKSNESRYQTVAQLAKSVLCVPPTSVSAKRLFSAAGNVVPRKSASLHPRNMIYCCFCCFYTQISSNFEICACIIIFLFCVNY